MSEMAVYCLKIHACFPKKIIKMYQKTQNKDLQVMGENWKVKVCLEVKGG